MRTKKEASNGWLDAPTIENPCWRFPNMQSHDSMFDSDCQELSERFAPKREFSIGLGDAYYGIFKQYRIETYFNRSERVKHCGSFLEFSHDIHEDFSISEKGKLHSANFCRDRLCPMCSWRRSLKVFSQLSRLVEYCNDDYEYVFLTLTVRNVEGSELRSTIDRMNGAWDYIRRSKWYKESYHGFCRVLEITRNNKNGSYHPHFHIILAVRNKYFSSSYYRSRNDWLEMWRNAYGDPTITQVDIQKVRPVAGSYGSAVAETAKYTLKFTDMLSKDGGIDTDIVYELAEALYNLRLLGFGGCFFQARKALKLDDAIDGDLVHVDEQEINLVIGSLIAQYGWSCGAYRLVSVKSLDMRNLE